MKTLEERWLDEVHRQYIDGEIDDVVLERRVEAILHAAEWGWADRMTPILDSIRTPRDPTQRETL